MELVHATCVEIDGAAVLLRGPSGSGKSDLALRLIDGGARLVADDQVQLSVLRGELVATAPDVLAGRLEVRGLGLIDLPPSQHVPHARVVLAIDLGPTVMRLPDQDAVDQAGVVIPRVVLAPFETSAAAKVRLALAVARRGGRLGLSPLPRNAADPMNSPVRLRTGVLLVTGMSGAGRSTALHLLEDLGYEAIDNVPLFLLRTLLQPGSDAPPHGAIAAGIDIRTRQFSVESFLAEVAPLQKRADLEVRLLFLDCDDDVLARRFTETRRRHPLAEDRPLIDGIRHERDVVGPLRAHADLVIDTSILSVPELRRLVNGHFRLERGPGLTVTVTSFSYREGLPREADLVFDVRFLANPHYDADLAPLTGKDSRVAAYVARDAAYAPFMEHLTQLLQSLLPSYSREGKTYLTIAVGCTGGRHRSVAVAEDIGRRLAAAGQPVTVRHRDTDVGA